MGGEVKTGNIVKIDGTVMGESRTVKNNVVDIADGFEKAKNAKRRIGEKRIQ